jgi:hypothetical protein
MKKIITILVFGIFFMSVIGASGYTNNLKNNMSKKSLFYDSITIEESFPDKNEYQIVNVDNYQKIILKDYNYLMDLGKPSLPYKNILIALPPGVRALSVDVEGTNPEIIDGNYKIIPSSELFPLENLNNNKIKDIKIEWKKNYENIYSSNIPYPLKAGNMIGSGSFRKYSYVLVSIYPFNYNSKTEKLIHFDSARITVNYEITSSNSLESIKKDTLIDEKAEKLFVNYNEIKHLYKPNNNQFISNEDTYNYVIITINDLYDTITSSSFVPWKESIGYDMKIVRITDPEITSQSGIDLGEKIRNFLREYYIEWGIEYVLIVGDYETIPMRYCYPDPTNHVNSAGTPGGPGGDVPTDYYYADLSSPDSESWDFDGDGYHGEYGHDKPDFLPEVYVGRIPINDKSRISYTLEKSVAFEQDTGDWKYNALHPAAFFYFTDELGVGEPAMDGATCCAYIENDFMSNWTVSRYSEQEGLEKSIYPWDPLSETAFANDWRTGKYAIVNWGAHGWSDLIARKVWSWDNGNGIPDANEIAWPTMLSTSSNLDDDYPSIVTSISCYVGYPEPNGWGNMGIDLLTKPSYGTSVGVISSARTPYGTSNWPTNPGASYSIIYEFNKYLINHSEKVGEAFFNSKYFCNINFNWYGWVEYNDLYTFNLYGDPSLDIKGIDIGGKPDKPLIPDGPLSGKKGENYTYSSSTTDPDDDQIYYMFDWGDGIDSGWLGPYNSGETCEESHTWGKEGNYEIKVRAKDTKELISEWSEPLEITIPRNRFSSRLIFLELLEKISILINQLYKI